MSTLDCLFCQPSSTTNHHLAHHGSAYARRDNYPAVDGHIEILPLRHVVSITDLTPREVLDMHLLLRRFITDGTADGWTIGINEGRAAGRTVDHLHMHVIPRRWGDVPDPRGGVRHVLPGTDPDAWAAGAQACGECGHHKAAHGEGDDPVTPGQCADCPEDEDRHDYRPATTERRPGLRERHRTAWAALTPAQQAARIAELDADDEQDGTQP